MISIASSDKKIVSVAVPRPLDQLFSYLVPPELSSQIHKGAWVKIPFGKTVTHGFILKEQVQDLKKTKKDLETILCSLDSQCRKVFRETFNAIKTNFSKNFEILFGGGEAELKYTDSPDILLAGIEIIAKPPGKQMKSISLLSGGEKCLTALALLFAIFEVKPAPFCILDEVDAPLDDSNIERFTNVLAKFIHKTQFIVVTHNKKTMSICDALYGVSMEERGVSVLISLAFETAKRREPSLIETSSK